MNSALGNLQDDSSHPIECITRIMTLSVSQCRELLGAEATGKSDAQIESMRDSLAFLANGLYDQLQADWKANPESVRWLAHAHDTGETE